MFLCKEINPLGDSCFMMALCYHELLADDISSSNANGNYNIINLPDYLIDDSGVKTVNQSPHKKMSGSIIPGISGQVMHSIMSGLTCMT